MNYLLERPEGRSVLTWNMLIGGPNQSHKVNFKEPLPVKGKTFKTTFAASFVNTFSGKTEIFF